MLSQEVVHWTLLPLLLLQWSWRKIQETSVRLLLDISGQVMNRRRHDQVTGVKLGVWVDSDSAA